MSLKNRTPREFSKLIEKAAKKIIKSKNFSDDFIRETCLEFDVSESYLRKIIIQK